MKYSISKTIEFDAAHRVPDHGSKCRNLHGHRYKVEVTVSSNELAGTGPETGMVMDFGFLKQLMEEFIHGPCDHGLIMHVEDHKLLHLLCPSDKGYVPWTKPYQVHVANWGSWTGETAVGKTYMVPFVPTAENLARHWYELLCERVSMRTQGRATIQRVRVYETPTSVCDYPS